MKAFDTFDSLETDKRRSLLLLFATGLLFWSSITILLPTLPTYIEDIGGTVGQVGWVMGSFAIGLLGSRTWLGHLADHRSRQLVIRIGTLVAAIAPLGYLCVTAIGLLMGIRAFHGISIAAFTTGYSALVVDLSPIKQRGELIGYMSLVVPIGMAIGPAIGGFLQETAGYGPLFLAAAGLGGLAFWLSWQIQATSYLRRQPVSGTIPLEGRSFWQLLSSLSLLIPALILLLVGLVFGTLVTFLPLYLRDSEAGLNAGWFYTAAAIASFAARVFSGQASDRYGRGMFITFSLAFYGISMGLLAIAQTPTEFLMAAIIEGTGGGVLIPMMVTLISDRSSSQERGRVYAVCIGGFDVGIAVAGPIFGALSQVIGYRYLFAVAGMLAVIALLLFLMRSNQNLKHSLRFALGQGKDLYALDD